MNRRDQTSYWLAAPPELPQLLAAPLAQHPHFGFVHSWSGEPEVRLSFDRRRGEPRNTDLLVECRDSTGNYLLAIEAKADEPFSETIAEAATAALERRLLNSRSRAYERVCDLAVALLSPVGKGQRRIGTLRYQLLTAAAGALAEGKRKSFDRVVLVIQGFRTTKTKDALHEQNARDLDSFVQRLSADGTLTVVGGQIVGPFSVPGTPLFDAPPRLYVMKVVCDLRGNRLT